MKSDLETLNPTRVKLTVEVPFEELKPSLDAAYKKIAGQVNIPGFRKGKVPPRVIDQRFGRAMVLEEAVNDALPQFYGKAVEEKDLHVLGRPEVDVTEFEDGQRLTFTRSAGSIQVDVNGAAKGSIEDDDFSRAFLAIWLGDSPPNSELKEGLLGGKCE